MIAFLRSHSHTQEQAGEKATEEQRPGRSSVPVTQEEPLVSVSASDRQDSEPEPGAPGLEDNHVFVDKSREVFLLITLASGEEKSFCALGSGRLILISGFKLAQISLHLLCTSSCACFLFSRPVLLLPLPGEQQQES